MKFKLTEGNLEVSDIQDANDRGRLANIEIAILRKIVTFKHEPTIDGKTSMSFRPERTEEVRTVLLGFEVKA